MIVKLSLQHAVCKHTQVQPTINNQVFPQRKDKVVVVMGATGTCKTRLSIDLATYFAGEIINSDKMQVYQGLDITTNKITDQERRGVHHHLLSIAHPESEFSAANFRTIASLSLQSILSREHLPIIVGGSNSFIEALVDEKFRLKYDCCFLWLDVLPSVHHAALTERVDKMVERGMVEEVRAIFHPNIDYTKGNRKAIGVPEFDPLFRAELFSVDEEARQKIMAEAIGKIKMNTSKLACQQLDKIYLLRNIKGWKMHRLDSTEVMKRYGGDMEEVWEEIVGGPGIAVVKKFVCDS